MTKVIPVDIYGCDVVVMFKPTEKELTTQKRGLKPKDAKLFQLYGDSDACHITVTEMPWRHWVIFSPETPKPCVSIIAHECFHLTCAILSQRGLRLTDSSEEAYAYLHGYLVDCVIQTLNKW